MSATPILERDAEVARVEGLMAAARSGEGGVLVIEGPAGIGNTRLLAEAEKPARRAGMRVLRAQGSELERGYAFGIARHLVEPAVLDAGRERRAALLDGAARLAAPILGLPDAKPEHPGSGGDQEEYAAVHGLYWLIANLAARRRCSSSSTTCSGWIRPPSARSPTSPAGSPASRSPCSSRSVPRRPGRVAPSPRRSPRSPVPAPSGSRR